jgi:hypothetical protein
VNQSRTTTSVDSVLLDVLAHLFAICWLRRAMEEALLPNFPICEVKADPSFIFE